MLQEIKNRMEHYFLDEYNMYHGTYKEWHANGQLHLLRNYNHGDRHGEWHRYSTDGQVMEYSVYNFGLLEGIQYDYIMWPDILVIANWKNDMLHGEYKHLYTNGSGRTKHLYYVNGKRIVDFIETPMSEKDRVVLALTHGAPLIPRNWKPPVPSAV